MPNVTLIQTNFTSGVLDPLAAAREDVVFFYNGLEDGYNVLSQPQGGLTRRDGLAHVAELLNKLAMIDLSGATVTAPMGGTASNGHDDDLATIVTTTGDVGTTNPAVFLHVDFGAARDVIAVDVLDYYLASGSLADELYIQYSTDNAAWTNLGTAFDVDATKRSRRRRADASISARYWRFARIGATATASPLNFAEVVFYEDTGELSNARLMPFAYSTDAAYMTVPTENNLDILDGNMRIASCGVPHTSAQLPVLNFTQSRDTMLLFHKQVHPRRIFRQVAVGSADTDEFDFRDQEFTNIPDYDYGAGVGGTDEVQKIWFDAVPTASDSFTILLDGERTDIIRGAAAAATVAANIQTALRALANTSAAGITVADITDGFTVTFGGDDGKKPWGEMSLNIVDGSRVPDVSRTTKGKYPGEPIFSPTRGYPRDGRYYQERLHMGGIEALPDVLVSSVVNAFYDLDTEQDLPTKALITPVNDDQVSAIYKIVAGRHLTIFTNGAEFYIPQEPISEESVLKLATRTGFKEGMPVFEVDGALLFMQGTRDDSGTTDREVATSLREFLFVDTVQSYEAPNVSKLAGHLIIDPQDAGLRKAVNTKEADMYLMINSDGTATAYTVLRNESVNSFIPQKTRDGDKFLQVGVDKKRRVYFVVERVINGITRRFIEMWTKDLLLDGGGMQTMVYEEFTATEGQTDFIWSFDNPAAAAAIGVRLDGGRLASGDYTATLGTKTVALAEGVPAGTKVRVAKMVQEISGLHYLAGETVQTVIDGTADNDFTVSEAGVLDIGRYADTEIQYGFDHGTYGKMMPFRIPETETLSGRKMRVFGTVLSLFETGGIEIRANGGNWQNVPLVRLDSDILDRSTAETEFTGEKIVRGMLGFKEGGYLEFRQSKPARLTIRAMTREVAI
jgi:hypothetical protein